MQAATTLRLFTLFLLSAVTVATPLAAANSRSEIFYADPTIYGEGGKYYLTGTRTGQPPGFALLESDDLREWRTPVAGAESLILRAGNGSFGTSRFWAPQIFKDGADYFLTYTADEHVALAKSQVLGGPYRQDTVGPIDNAERNIDSYLFRDDDGRYYLYHVRFRRGNFLWVAEFDLKAGRIKPATLTSVLVRPKIGRPRRATGRSRSWKVRRCLS